MKGSTKLWLSVWIAVYLWLVYGAYTEDFSNNGIFTNIWQLVTVLLLGMDIAFGILSEGDVKLGPVSWFFYGLSKLIGKINKIADKHLSDEVHKVD